MYIYCNGGIEMGIRYDDQMLIKIQAQIKAEAEKRAEKTGRTLSQYIRELILKDIKKI